MGEYDIHVLAFPAASARTVQGLCELFGIDAKNAQRVIRGTPSVLRQRVPAAEAEACAQALRKLGARVVLEPAQQREPPPPPAAAYLQQQSPQGTRGANDNLPRPAPRTAAADLEYDVLSALGAALDGHAPVREAAPRNPPQELTLEQLEEPLPEDRLPGGNAAGQGGIKGRHQEIDLGVGGAARSSMELDLGGSAARTSLELELDGGATREQRKPLEPAQRKPVQPHASGREAAQGTTQPRQPIAPTGASRAALVERSASKPERSRNLPLLQLLAACGVFAVGYWADSSVLYGSASLTSVVAHGLALQQILLGLRGLFR